MTSDSPDRPPLENVDALLLVSFGGPEGPGDVMPFLENVVRGRNVPRARLLAVAEHYHQFGGRSPINEQNRALIAALEERFVEAGFRLPIYFGNRNWHPLLVDTLRQMRDDGIARALVFVTSAYGSYSGCRQYREDVQAAALAVGPGAPAFTFLPRFYNDPGFVAANADRVREALAPFPAARLVFTAHAIPLAMAETSPYERQLRATAGWISERVGRAGVFDLAWQSRSGPAHIPWLSPDILDHLATLRDEGERAVVVAPIGFLSDHMEVVYDLDTEASARARELGLAFTRAKTVGTHPAFVGAIVDWIRSQLTGEPRETLGDEGVFACLPECCASPRRS